MKESGPFCLAARSRFDFARHILISCFAAVPLLVVLHGISDRRPLRVLTGALYGTAFYVVINSLALPLAFGDASL